MGPRDVPDGLDADTSRRVQRSFLLVRIVRGCLLLAFLGLAVAGSAIDRWPSGVTVAIAVAMLVQATALLRWSRQWAATRASAARGRS